VSHLPKETAVFGPLQVTWQDDRGGTNTDVFDTVLVATGRHAATKSLNLGSVGVKTAANGKIIGREASGAFAEHSSVDSIFAIGDCLEGKPELTPVCCLARRCWPRDMECDYRQRSEQDDCLHIECFVSNPGLGLG
jgi:pyruvate/2-oxoglutarate dehydrogenase complex dihydrolipoamide dehydrogenase (E3) component